MSKSVNRICVVEGCGSEAHSQGLCPSHYMRRRRHGNAESGRGRNGDPLAFLEKAVSNPTNECVVWPYSSNGKHGEIWFQGRRWKAHRLALSMVTGVNPPDLLATHGPCANSMCINPHPEHGMSWATQKENIQHAVTRDGTISRGEKRPGAKLTDSAVVAILSDNRPHTVVAADYQVSASVIGSIKRGLIWKHVRAEGRMQ